MTGTHNGTRNSAASDQSDLGSLPRTSSVLSHPAFLPMVGVIFVLGQLTDLLGTYVAQPHFEHEGNWLISALTSAGVHVGWNSAILGKSIVCALGIACLEFFAQHCRKFYPVHRMSGSELLHYFVHGESQNAKAENVQMSRDVRALLVLFAGFWALSGPIYLYMGYDNLAAHFGWLRFSGFYIGGVYQTWGDVILLLSTMVTMMFLIEGDHHSLIKEDATIGSIQPDTAGA